jgi:hypothetical protein
LTSKVCRKDNFYDYLDDLVKNKRYNNDRINEEVKGMTVVTSYAKGGKHTYRIESVDFSKTPNDGFTKKDETFVKFSDYYYH